MTLAIQNSTQRVLLAVPSPRTELAIGQFFEAPRTDASTQTVTSQYSGFSVYTTADVRFNAHGAWSETNKQSDLIAQSKGQLWLQAMGKMVGLAGSNLLLSSVASTMIAGQGGVTILSGFRPDTITPEPEAGTFPAAVAAYEDKAKAPTMAFTILDTIFAVGLTALDAYLRISDRPSGKSGYDAWGVEGGLANLAGAAINIAGLTGSPNVSLPGINIFSQAGNLVATPMGALNIFGVPGAIIASPFTTQFGLVVSGIRGLFSAGVVSLKTADLTAIADVTVRASQDLTLASRTGDVVGRGASMKIGNIKPGATPQLPTTSLKMQAVERIGWRSYHQMKLAARSISAKSALSTSMEGGNVRFKVGTFEISLTQGDAKIGSSTAGTITLTDDGVKIAGPGGTAKAELAATKIDLVAGAGSCKLDLAGKKLTVDGTTFDIK